jgi:hypothetical protein
MMVGVFTPVKPRGTIGHALLAGAALILCWSCTQHPMVRREVPQGPDACMCDENEQPDTEQPDTSTIGIDSPLGGAGGSRGTGGSGAGGAAVDVRPRGIRVQKLTGNTRFTFGGLVAVSGNTVAIASEASSLVYFFERAESGFSQSAVVAVPMVSQSGGGISSLALSGDAAAVGAFNVTAPGWVHVLRRTAEGGFAVEGRVDDPAADAQAEFGCAVALSGDTLVVGAKRNFDGKPGTAFVFVKRASGWEVQATLASGSDGTPPTDLANDRFGSSVAISANTVAVARPMSQRRGALLFHRSNDTWQRDPTFQPGVVFGQPVAVALDGSRLLLGDNANEAGYVYQVDDAGGWTGETSLTARPESNLGYSVALAGRLAVLGGLAPSGGRNAPGNAYVFVRREEGWSAPIALVPDGEPPPAGFGTPVAASGTTIVVGARFALESGSEAGAAYVFDLDLGAAM